MAFNQPYGYQTPQFGGYGQQMQSMYQPYQQMQSMQTTQQQDAQLFCRPVASADEARGVPVDFTGKPMFFPHLNAGRIYMKVFDSGNGSAIFREFRLVDPEPEPSAQPAVAFAPLSEVEQLKQTVTDLQNEIRTMKAGKRRAQTQEAMTDEV